MAGYSAIGHPQQSPTGRQERSLQPEVEEAYEQFQHALTYALDCAYSGKLSDASQCLLELSRCLVVSSHKLGVSIFPSPFLPFLLFLHC